MYRQYASYLSMYWNLIGNGHSCALPMSKIHLAQAEDRNLIYLGLSERELQLQLDWISWDRQGMDLDGAFILGGSMFVVLPDENREGVNDRVMAVVSGSEGWEHLLYSMIPFSSRSGMPDYLVWNHRGAQAIGFWGMDWQFNSDWHIEID